MHWREAQEMWLQALESEGRSVWTLAGYRGHLAPFNRWLGATGVQDIGELTPFHLRRFLNEYAQGRSPHTVRGVYGNMRSWLRWLVAEGVLVASPTERVKAPKAPETSKEVYSQGELATLLKYVERDKTPLGLRNKALVSLLADTGARCSELLGLTLDDLVGDCLLLRHTKAKRLRMVPLGEKSQRVLWLYVQRGRPKLRPRDKTVFLAWDGRPLTRNALRCVLARVGKALGFPVSAHRFRHT